jgi:hypothetical protein
MTDIRTQLEDQGYDELPGLFASQHTSVADIPMILSSLEIIFSNWKTVSASPVITSTELTDNSTNVDYGSNYNSDPNSVGYYIPDDWSSLTSINHAMPSSSLMDIEFLRNGGAYIIIII